MSSVPTSIIGEGLMRVREGSTCCFLVQPPRSGLILKAGSATWAWKQRRNSEEQCAGWRRLDELSCICSLSDLQDFELRTRIFIRVLSLIWWRIRHLLLLSWNTENSRESIFERVIASCLKAFLNCNRWLPKLCLHHCNQSVVFKRKFNLTKAKKRLLLLW